LGYNNNSGDLKASHQSLNIGKLESQTSPLVNTDEVIQPAQTAETAEIDTDLLEAQM